jgi:hypothetical protein
MTHAEDIGIFSSCMPPDEQKYFKKIKFEKNSKVLRKVSK